MLVAQTILFVGTSILIGFALAAYIAWWLVVPLEAFMVTLFVVNIITMIIGFGLLIVYEEGRKKTSQSLVVQYVRAKKNKYCPYIEYKA
jgi:hypothetical protein